MTTIVMIIASNITSICSLLLFQARAFRSLGPESASTQEVVTFRSIPTVIIIVIMFTTNMFNVTINIMWSLESVGYH